MTRKKKNKRSAGISLMPFIIIVGLLVILATLFLGYRISISEKKFITISLIALFAGLLFESFRVSDNLKSIFLVFVGSYFLSLFSFLPGKREYQYNFDRHLEMWPFYFIVVFTIIFGFVNKDKVTAKLTEGITLLLSISALYWAIDIGILNYLNGFSIFLLIIAFAFILLSILNALTNMHLSNTNRLTLSIGSTIIICAFALDNIIRVLNHPEIENSPYLSTGLSIGIQYFLLGVSAVYIMQNFMLLVEFLPSRHGNYKEELIEIKKDHIERYSNQQVSIESSIFCIVFTVSIYSFNYNYEILPRHTMIWLVIFSFPIILYLLSLMFKQKI